MSLDSDSPCSQEKCFKPLNKSWLIHAPVNVSGSCLDFLSSLEFLDLVITSFSAWHCPDALGKSRDEIIFIHPSSSSISNPSLQQTWRNTLPSWPNEQYPRYLGWNDAFLGPRVAERCWHFVKLNVRRDLSTCKTDKKTNLESSYAGRPSRLRSS